MKKYILVLLLLSCKAVSAQVEMRVMAMPDTRNENGYYTQLKAAQENVNDVRTLSIEKSDGDSFLSKPTTFPKLETLAIHFSTLKTIGSLTANRMLKEIGISYSWELQTLPDDITGLPLLESIKVSNCSLVKLPFLFFSSKTLKDVCLCQNQLSSLPAIPEGNSITHLYLDINRFSTLPSDFRNLEQLETLTLKDCRFSEFPMEILTLKNLRVLDLSANDIAAIPSELSELPKLERLYLVRTSVKELPKSLKKTSLRYVAISDTNLSQKEKKAIVKNLPKGCEVEWKTALNYVVDDSSCVCLKTSYLE